MRKLMWFSLGFGGACIWGSWFNGRGWIFVLPVLIGGAVGLLIGGRKRKMLCCLALFFLGCAAGMGWFQTYDRLYLSQAVQLDGKTETAVIEITDPGRKTAYGYSAEGIILKNGRKYRTVLYLGQSEAAAGLSAGNRISGFFKFFFSSAENERYHYMRSKGIFLMAYQKGDLQVSGAEGTGARYFPFRLRQRLLQMLEEIFPEDTEAFAKALLLGDTREISYRDDTAFKISGIRHVVAVSGLHISILFSVINLLCGRKRFLVGLVGIPCLLLFSAIAGFTPSVTRACVMESLMLAALMVNREYDPPTALAFAALVMLIGNPLVITSVGFQLSVGCVAGIFMFSGPISRWLLSPGKLGAAKGKSLKNQMKRWLAGSVSVTLGTMAVTTPLSAWHFGTVSLVGVVTNLLTLWMVTLVFYGLIVTCGAGLLWLPLGRAIAWLFSWGIRYIQVMARLLSRLPMAAIYTKSIYIVLWLVFVYVLMGVFLLTKRKKPAVFAGCMALSLCVSVLISWLEPMADTVRMTVVDVGQGQCVLLQSGGKTVVVDCGGASDRGSADEAAEHLLCQGIRKIDCLVVTHFDHDHIGGAANLLSRTDADLILVPDVEDPQDEVGPIAGTTGGKIHRVSSRLLWRSGEVKMYIYPPVYGGSDNETSLCVLFQTGKYAILITGDRSQYGERILLEQTQLPEVDALVVGHHGSASSTCEELLEQTKPDFAFISSGRNNRYGHPAQEVLDRLESYGCVIRRTDQQGTIIFRR